MNSFQGNLPPPRYFGPINPRPYVLPGAERPDGPVAENYGGVTVNRQHHCANCQRAVPGLVTRQFGKRLVDTRLSPHANSEGGEMLHYGDSEGSEVLQDGNSEGDKGAKDQNGWNYAVPAMCVICYMCYSYVGKV
ncbi:hypothetical protein M404DRAFT_1006244 [Pisolithus tinctorius Marx 270]|uniref:Uncharacterized protein n=1 Tax=Pisolithus tinctorius Marx 270 TaxID=870435 RepID=A0A0C3IJP5_PISTI|nr:hypothetical protein M404DRAFT_1006244 [Pisolithus tinctorius Marx 270]